MQEEKILDYPQAAALVRVYCNQASSPSRVETVEIGHALGRCLAADILADRHQPPFDRSTRDGYAIHAADLVQAKRMRVIGQLRAGQAPFDGNVGRGEALEIMTGSPMPAGADSVLMVEHVQKLDSASIQAVAGRSLSPGDNVVPAGSEAKAGDIVVPAGTRLSPMHLGAAASCGAATVEVYARPRVAILATGDELVEPHDPMLDFQIRNSNSYSMAAQVERAGGVPLRLPIVRDDLDSLREALSVAMQADLILLSGGVSMGKFDFVEQALARASAEFFFTGVRMQPGRPVVFGRLTGEKYFFGLPGNPISTMVTFTLFAGPLIRALGGEREALPLFAQARLSTSVEYKTGLTRFLPAQLTAAWDHAAVKPVVWQGSGDLAAVARANCFVVIPPDRPQLASGDAVNVLLAYS